jgi:hypothetical protein
MVKVARASGIYVGDPATLPPLPVKAPSLEEKQTVQV